MMKYKLLLFFFLVASLCSAQVPGPVQRTALLTLQQAKTVESSKAGQFGLTDAQGNQRYAQFVEIDLVPIGYTPTATGNTQNYSEFVTTATGDVWYIDWQGRGKKISGSGGAACDYDWLQISDNSCPNAITDSIYKYKYVAIGARYVWPLAQLLVSDSTNEAAAVIAGQRGGSLVIYNNITGNSTTLQLAGSGTNLFIDSTGTFSIKYAAGGTQALPSAATTIMKMSAVDSTLQLAAFSASRPPDTAVLNNIAYYGADGKFRKRPVDDLTAFVTPERFGAKADFKRLTGLSATRGTKIVTCSSCFSKSDVGKLIAIAYARIDTGYNIARRVTMNSRVVSFNNSSSIVIDSFIDVNTTNVKGYIATNNFDAIQTMLEFCDTSKTKLVMLGAGTYLSVPSKGTKQRAGFLGLQTLGSIYIKGQGQGVSTIKVGEEFIQRANLAATNAKRVNGLNIYKDGSQIFEDFTLESADTVSTEFVGGSPAFYTEQRANQIQSIIINRVTTQADWSEALNSSRGGSATRAYKVLLSNDTLAGKAQPVSYFSQDGANKILTLDKVVFIGGGQKAADTLTAAVNVSSGSNILTVTTPGFSWYNYYTPSGRNWNVWVNGAPLGAITSITSPTVATVTTNSAVNVTAGQLRVNYATDGVFGHILYIHPNVSIEARDCDYYKGNDINIYSSGGVPGVQGYNRWIRNQLNGKSNIGFYADQTNIITKPFANGGYTYFEDCPRFSSLLTIGKSVIKGYTTGLVLGDTVKLIDVKTYPFASGFLDLRVGGFCEMDGGSIGSISINGAGKYVLRNVGAQQNSSGLTILNAGQIQATGCSFMKLSPFIATGNLSTSKLFKFDECTFGLQPYLTTFDQPTLSQSMTYNSTQLEIFRQMWSFSNCSWDGGNTLVPIANIPAGFLPVSEGVNNANGIYNTRSNDIDTLYSAIFSTRGNKVGISTKNGVNYIVYGSVNVNIVSHFLYNTPLWRGTLQVNCIDTFLINPGINVRTLVSRKRAFNEVVNFQFQPDKAILQEISSTTNNTSIAKPTRTGRIGERVKKSNFDGTEWVYRATINSGVKNTSMVGASLPVLETLVDKPTLGYEYADRYVAPDTMLSISVPTSLGTEVFTVNKYGQLVGASGGTGFINFRTKQIKIVTLGASATLNTAGTLTTNYKYFTGGAWIEDVAWKVSGNTVAGYKRIGTNDNYSLRLYTNNLLRATIDSTGQAGFGVALPTAGVHLRPGASGVGGSPLKFSIGAKFQASLEPGSVNFDGGDWYGSDGTYNYNFVKSLIVSPLLDFPDTAPHVCEELNVTLVGVSDRDPIIVGVPTAVMPPQGFFTAYVSAANTITVRYCNTSAGNLDPSLGTFKLTTVKQ
jgi:hypothetical protein